MPSPLDNIVILQPDEVTRIHDKLERVHQLEIELGQARSMNLKLQLVGSALLEIAERSAIPKDIQACANARQMLGEGPKVKSGSLFKPSLVVDNTEKQNVR